MSYVVSVSCWLCTSLLPACLFFPLRGGFCSSLFYFIIKIIYFLHLSPRPHTSWQNGSAKRGLSRELASKDGCRGEALQYPSGRRENWGVRQALLGSRSAMENTCLLVFFWRGLAEPFKSRMPYWVPEDSLEVYINQVLNLSSSAFRMELATEPAPVQEPTEPPPFREPTESAPEPAPFRTSWFCWVRGVPGSTYIVELGTTF